MGDSRSAPLILPLEQCHDPAVAGGKAVSLGFLMRKGFRVPRGVCLTTGAYDELERRLDVQFGREWNLALELPEGIRQERIERIHRHIQSWTLPDFLLDALEGAIERINTSGISKGQMGWAVRSSAVSEDGADGSFAGLFKTCLGVTREDLPSAVLECWASQWSPGVYAYLGQGKGSRAAPRMAVVIQEMVNPRAAGVAYSCHPVTGSNDQVVVDAVFGLAEPLVSGRVSPDHLIVGLESTGGRPRLVEHRIATKMFWRPAVAGRFGQEQQDESLPEEQRNAPVLEEPLALELARVIRQVEKEFDIPVDVEWAVDDTGFWILQARPVTTVSSFTSLTNQACAWSRANVKETLPELPSPLALDFLCEYMETAIMRHYRELGCWWPEDVSSIRIINGRPFINVTLFQAMLVQFGEDPDLVSEQMGGQTGAVPFGIPSMPVSTLLRSGCRILYRMWRAQRDAPTRFEELKRAGDLHYGNPLESSALHDVLLPLREFRERIPKEDIPFAISAGISQSLTLLGALLRRRIPQDWRNQLNAVTQGLGTIISAKQAMDLLELAREARRDPRVYPAFLEENWSARRIMELNADSGFARSLRKYLEEYGHRAIGESDIMSPRFSETPEYILGIIRSYLAAEESPIPERVMEQQQRTRREALLQIRRAFGWRVHEWWMFRWLHRRLSIFSELREANRHYLMYYLAGIRRVLLEVSHKMIIDGRWDHIDDVFFLTQDELQGLDENPDRDWRVVIRERRNERDNNSRSPVPDWIPLGHGGTSLHASSISELSPDMQNSVLTGIPVSAGYSEGPVRFLKSPHDIHRVRQGDIVVMPVLDPGWAPFLGLAGGLIIEIGGTLSHGAIIAREFGVPTLVNVPRACAVLREGQRVLVDASEGRLLILQKSPNEDA